VFERHALCVVGQNLDEGRHFLLFGGGHSIYDCA
jgi:hypothetical protein